MTQLRTFLAASLSLASIPGFTTPVPASEVSACVSVAPPCDAGVPPDSAFRSGESLISGGGELRGEARADATEVGARFFASTALASDHDVSGSAAAVYQDDEVVVEAEGFTNLTLLWTIKLTGTFSGSDSGSPCENCDDESPWLSSANALAKSTTTGVPNATTRTMDLRWDSNRQLYDGDPTEQTLLAHVVEGVPFGWRREITTDAAATLRPCFEGGEDPCTSEGGAAADADFRTTLVFRDFLLFDADSGQPIEKFSVTGRGGIDYLAIDRGCGDGNADDGEQCDDGNVHSGDCCSSSCQNEEQPCGASECGDFDNSGEVTASDALGALRSAVGLAQCAFCRCDANDSSSVTASDAQRILGIAVGQPLALACDACG